MHTAADPVFMDGWVKPDHDGAELGEELRPYSAASTARAVAFWSS